MMQVPPMDPTMQQQQPPPPQHMMPPQHQPQQWGMMPPPPQPQYHHQHHMAQPPPAMWGQQPSQIPPPQPMQQMAPPPQPQSVMAQFAPPQQQQPQQQANSNEIKSLWIGDLQYWMDESYLHTCFAHTGGAASVKVIRNKQTGQSEGYGFVEFHTHATAEQTLQTYNGQMMPSAEQAFRLNWAAAGERRGDDGPDYTIFVGDLASDVTDFMLQELFRARYPSIKGAKVVTDRATGRSKGYGFVRFGDANEQTRAMNEMNGMLCSTRPMRIGPAANKKTTASYQTPQGTDSENDSNNTTIFVGGLDQNVSEESLRQVFSQYGELVHVKIPVGKRCGFVQFASRQCAEEALSMLNGTQLGGQNIRLSWGRSPSNKNQPQSDANQWNSNYYGYGQQSYDTYGYAQPAQDPNMYAYAAYQYGNYQQPPPQQ